TPLFNLGYVLSKQFRARPFLPPPKYAKLLASAQPKTRKSHDPIDLQLAGHFSQSRHHCKMRDVFEILDFRRNPRENSAFQMAYEVPCPPPAIRRPVCSAFHWSWPQSSL